ncbi:MAG: hypothetical protein ACLQVG_26905 [Terriglobia bacterium]
MDSDLAGLLAAVVRRLTYVDLVEQLSPLMPGSILVLGWMLSQQSKSGTFPLMNGLGYKTKLAVLVLGVYAAGLLLRFVCENFVAYSRLAKAPRVKPWEDGNWQRLAAIYVERVTGSPVSKELQKDDWEWWYRTMSFTSREQPLDVTWHLAVTVMTSGVAGLLLSLLILIGSYRLWLFLLAAGAVAVVGAWVCWKVLGHALGDQSEHSAARMLAELREGTTMETVPHQRQ